MSAGLLMVTFLDSPYEEQSGSMEGGPDRQ